MSWRGARFLKGAVKKVTLTRTAAFLLVLGVGFYLYRELARDVLIIEPFNVPKQYADMGLTGEVIANHISDALDEIERDATTKDNNAGLKFDRFMLSGDLPATIDVEVPGTKLGLKTVVEIAREVFGVHPKRVRGDVVLAPGPAGVAVCITVLVSQSDHPRAPRRLTSPVNDAQLIPQFAAEAILRDVNPFLLAIYKYWQEDLDTVAEIAHDMVTSPERFQRARAHDLLGLVHSGRQRWEDAIEEYREATQLAPQLAFAYSNWGLMLDQLGKLSEATSKYQKATELDPAFARAYTFWGYTLYKLDKPVQATAKFQKAIELNPRDPAVYLNWGAALAGLGKEKEAIAKYQKAIELDPKFATAYIFWGDTLSSQGRWEEAAEKYKKAIETNPKSTDAYNSWGTMLYKQGKLDDAIAKFQKTIQLDPKRTDAYNIWGYTLDKLGRHAEAEEKFAKARELSSLR